VPKRLSKRLARLEELAQAEPQTAEARDLFVRIKQLTEAYRRGERSGDLAEYAEVPGGEALRGVQVMAEAHLIAYECPKCGKRTKALPRADIWCPCGRKMKQKKAGASKGDRP